MADPSVLVAHKALALTEEEAFALLEMCTLTLAAERPSHLRVLSELGRLCREWLTPPSTPLEAELGASLVDASTFLDDPESKVSVVSTRLSPCSLIPGATTIDASVLSWISFARSA